MKIALVSTHAPIYYDVCMRVGKKGNWPANLSFCSPLKEGWRLQQHWMQLQEMKYCQAISYFCRGGWAVHWDNKNLFICKPRPNDFIFFSFCLLLNKHLNIKFDLTAFASLGRLNSVLSLWTLLQIRFYDICVKDISFLFNKLCTSFSIRRKSEMLAWLVS